MPMNVTIILGHPDASSYCGSLADTYADAARRAGHDVRLFRLGDIAFDPVLHHGYHQRQELEPGLLELREAITWARHLVFVYPVWWGSMPALLKGFFDRTFLPGYAFKYRDNSPFWDKLLAGRSADVITTMDTPPWYYRFIYTRPGHHQIRKTILEFSGITPVRITSLGPVRYATQEKREQWRRKVEKLAQSA